MSSEVSSDLRSRNSEEFSDRLKLAIGDEKPTAFAKRHGLTVSAFMKYFNGTQPVLDTATLIAEKAGVNLEWLATGRGPMRSDRLDSSEEIGHGRVRTQPEHSGLPMLQIASPDKLVEGAMILVPRLTVSASAGTGSIVGSEEVHDFVAFTSDYIRSLGVNPKFAKMHSVKGDSMNPTLVDGEWVLIDTAIDHVIDEGLYTVVYGGSLLIKRIRMLRDGGITLVSDNHAAGYPDETIRKADLYDLQIAGRVRGHFRFT